MIPILLRPVDSTGDILPVLSVSSCLKDSAAVAQLALYCLKLLKGEWWESPSRGCAIMETLQSSRLTEESAERKDSIGICNKAAFCCLPFFRWMVYMHRAKFM